MSTRCILPVFTGGAALGQKSYLLHCSNNVLAKFCCVYITTVLVGHDNNDIIPRTNILRNLFQYSANAPLHPRTLYCLRHNFIRHDNTISTVFQTIHACVDSKISGSQRLPVSVGVAKFRWCSQSVALWKHSDLWAIRRLISSVLLLGVVLLSCLHLWPHVCARKIRVSFCVFVNSAEMFA